MPTPLPDLSRYVAKSLDLQSGEPVFVGTRVPVRSLLDYLAGGESLEEFLHQFPSVGREQCVAVLERSFAAAVADAHPA